MADRWVLHGSHCVVNAVHSLVHRRRRVREVHRGPDLWTGSADWVVEALRGADWTCHAERHVGSGLTWPVPRGMAVQQWKQGRQRRNMAGELYLRPKCRVS